MSAGAASALAVFLGPSLRPEAATALLSAQYLPPAQFGDVYRLIGSGVRAIVLLDGVFHGRAPVWQRELLYALQSGVRVYGAASMGALRAAELHTYGMVGLGTVFGWYESGVIDGDDEVALLHAGPEQQYRPLTLPLVQVRFALREAVARGVLEPESAAALIAHLKALPFWERTANALWEAPACQSLDPLRRAGLRALLSENAVDVKGADAALALAEVARREQELPPAIARSIREQSPLPSHHDRFRLLKRGFPHRAGGSLEGAAIVERSLTDAAQRQRLRWSLGARFFLQQWARENASRVPDLVKDAAVTPWPAEQLCAHSLTAAEHDALRARQVLLTWILAQPPEQFGLSSSLQDEALLPAFLDCAHEALPAGLSRAAIARALPYIAAWCDHAGVAPPPEASAELGARWHVALAALAARDQAAACDPFLRAVWTIEQGPVHFGYATWSLAAELLSDLQHAGAAAAHAARWEAPCP